DLRRAPQKRFCGIQNFLGNGGLLRRVCAGFWRIGTTTLQRRGHHQQAKTRGIERQMEMAAARGTWRFLVRLCLLLKGTKHSSPFLSHPAVQPLHSCTLQRVPRRTNHCDVTDLLDFLLLATNWAPPA